MEQITIDEILKLTEQDTSDTKEWRPIRYGARIGLTSYLPLIYPGTEHDTSESAIDYVTFGRVDDVPAAIGFQTWLSNGVEEYEPIQWRPITRKEANT